MANNRRDLQRAAFWRDVLAQQRASGLSIRAFCRREKLREPSFYAWRRELARRAAEQSPDGPALRVTRRPRTKQAPSIRRAPRPKFVPIVLRGDPPSRPAELTIELCGGRVLRLPEAMAAERLAEIVIALEARTAR